MNTTTTTEQAEREADARLSSLIAACQFPDPARAAWAMFQLIGAMRAKGWWYTLECDEDDEPHYATFSKVGACYDGRGDTPMQAVARAATASLTAETAEE